MATINIIAIVFVAILFQLCTAANQHADTPSYIPFPDVAIPPIFVDTTPFAIPIRLAMPTTGSPVTIDLTWYPLPLENQTPEHTIMACFPLNEPLSLTLQPLSSLGSPMGPFKFANWSKVTDPDPTPANHNNKKNLSPFSAAGGVDIDLTPLKTTISQHLSATSDYHAVLIDLRFDFWGRSPSSAIPPNITVGSIAIKITLGGDETPQDQTPFYGKFDIISRVKPWTLNTADATTPVLLNFLPTLAYTHISPWEPLLGDAFLPLMNQFVPFWDSQSHEPPAQTNRFIMRWAISMPWNLSLGGFNRNGQSTFAGVRPERVRLSTVGSLWFLNNSTAVFDGDHNTIPTTCLINDVEVGATLNREPLRFDFPPTVENDDYGQQQQQQQQQQQRELENGYSEQVSITLHLDSIFWTSLLGPVHSPTPPSTITTTSDTIGGNSLNGNHPLSKLRTQSTSSSSSSWVVTDNSPIFPLGFANFTISCPSVPMFATSARAVEVLLSELNHGILMEIIGQDNASSMGHLQSEMDQTTAMVVPLIITSRETGTSMRLTPSGSFLTKVPHHWIHHSPWGVSSQQQQQTHLPPLQTTTQTTSLDQTTTVTTTFIPSTPPQPFPIISPPTAVALANAPDHITKSTTITTMITMVLELESFKLFQDAKSPFLNALRISIPNPGEFFTLTPVNYITPYVNIFLLPLEDNPEGKVWMLQAPWHKSNLFQTQDISIPQNLFPTPGDSLPRQHWQISFNIDLSGRNPWETGQLLRFFDEVHLVCSFQDYTGSGNPHSFPIIHHVPITRWFRDAGEVLASKDDVIIPNYNDGAGFFHTQYDTLRWDFYPVSTTKLDTVLLFDNAKDAGAIPDVVESVTIHTNNWYQFQHNNTGTDPILLHCTNYLAKIIDECIPTSITIAPGSVSFKITLKAQPAPLTKEQIPTKIAITAGPTLTITNRPYIVVNNSGYPSPPEPILNLIATVQILPQQRAQQQQQPQQTISLALSFKLNADPAKVFSARAHNDRYVPPTPPPEKKHSVLFWLFIASMTILIIVTISVGVIKWKVDQVEYKSKQDQLFLEELVLRDNQERDDRERQMGETLRSMNKAFEANSPPTYVDVSTEELPAYDLVPDRAHQITDAEPPLPYNDDWSVNHASTTTHHRSL